MGSKFILLRTVKDLENQIEALYNIINEKEGTLKKIQCDIDSYFIQRERLLTEIDKYSKERNDLYAEILCGEEYLNMKEKFNELQKEIRKYQEILGFYQEIEKLIKSKEELGKEVSQLLEKVNLLNSIIDLKEEKEKLEKELEELKIVKKNMINIDNLCIGYCDFGLVKDIRTMYRVGSCYCSTIKYRLLDDNDFGGCKDLNFCGARYSDCNILIKKSLSFQKILLLLETYGLLSDASIYRREQLTEDEVNDILKLVKDNYELFGFDKPTDKINIKKKMV